MLELTLSSIKYAAAASIFLSALLAGLLPLHSANNNLKYFEHGKALSAGIFLGAALIHMLNEASLSLFSQGIEFPWAPVLAGSAFLFLLWLEHLGRELEHRYAYSDAIMAYLATAMLCFHSAIEGAALGVNIHVNTSIILFMAIMAHKWAASFALACHLCSSRLSRQRQLILFVLFCFMTPAALLIGHAFTGHATSALVSPICSAMAAGTFLYIGTLHGLRNAVMVERCCDLKQFVFVILGFILMGILAYWL